MRENVPLMLGAAAVSGWVLWVAYRDVPRVLWVLWWGQRAPGQIVREEDLGFYLPAKLPVASYRDAAGMRHEFRSPYARPTSYREMMGEVTVAYDPARPRTHAVLVGWRYYWRHLFGWLLVVIFPAGLLLALWHM
jgi:hypothetical protein